MNEKQIWDRLYSHIRNPDGVAGVMGNFQAESAMKANNLQDSYQGSIGMNDEQYTAAVDSGSYGNFVHDSAGYGYFQATYWSIKQYLLNYARNHGKSIGELQKMGTDVGVAWQDGRMFQDPWGIRMNLALPFHKVQEAFDRLDRYVFNAK